MIDVAIIGAGISGSIAAAYLRQYQISHCILEKYETIGGRFSSIEIEGKRYNHSNLFLRDSHINLAELVNQFLEKPLEQIRLDYVNIIDDQYHIDSRFIYLPETGYMSDICAKLSKESSVEYNQDIVKIIKQSDHFEIHSKTAQWKARHIVLTTPPTTSRDLLSQLSIEIDIPPTNSIFTLLAEYDEIDFDFPYYKFINHNILKEIFVNKKDKTLVIHANDYIHASTDTLNEDLIQKTIYETFQKYFHVEIKIVGFKIWKYGKDRVKKDFQNNFTLADNQIFLFTDWVSSKKNSNGVEDSFQDFHRNIQRLLG